mgnify:CR=1 FL=1
MMARIPRYTVVLPAQAGVIRPGEALADVGLRAPRAGGGDPLRLHAYATRAACSPRRRG